MPRDITITFSDGTKHQYNNTPDSVTPDDIEKRAKKDYPNKKISNISGGKKKPAGDPLSADPISANARPKGSADPISATARPKGSAEPEQVKKKDDTQSPPSSELIPTPTATPPAIAAAASAVPSAGNTSDKNNNELNQIKKNAGLQQQDITDPMTGEIKGSIPIVKGDKGSTLSVQQGVGVLIDVGRYPISYNSMGRGYPMNASARIKIGDNAPQKAVLNKENYGAFAGRLDIGFLGASNSKTIKTLMNFSGEVKVGIAVANPRYDGTSYEEVFTFNF